LESRSRLLSSEVADKKLTFMAIDGELVLDALKMAIARR
jgi:hypothetical protein